MRGTSTLCVRGGMRGDMRVRHLSCGCCGECGSLLFPFWILGERLRAPGCHIAAFCVRSHTLRLNRLMHLMAIPWVFLQTLNDSLSRRSQDIRVAGGVIQ